MSKTIPQKPCKIWPRVQLMTNRKSYQQNPLWTLYDDPNKGSLPQFGEPFISVKLMELGKSNISVKK